MTLKWEIRYPQRDTLIFSRPPFYTEARSEDYPWYVTAEIEHWVADKQEEVSKSQHEHLGACLPTWRSTGERTAPG